MLDGCLEEIQTEFPQKQASKNSEDTFVSYKMWIGPFWPGSFTVLQFAVFFSL